MITSEELQQLHDNLEFEVKLKLKESKYYNYDGYGQDIITLNMYKEQLQNDCE